MSSGEFCAMILSFSSLVSPSSFFSISSIPPFCCCPGTIEMSLRSLLISSTISLSTVKFSCPLFFLSPSSAAAADDVTSDVMDPAKSSSSIALLWARWSLRASNSSLRDACEGMEAPERALLCSS